jgi:hypothetical protein
MKKKLRKNKKTSFKIKRRLRGERKEYKSKVRVKKMSILLISRF